MKKMNCTLAIAIKGRHQTTSVLLKMRMSFSPWEVIPPGNDHGFIVGVKEKALKVIIKAHRHDYLLLRMMKKGKQKTMNHPVISGYHSLMTIVTTVEKVFLSGEAIGSASATEDGLQLHRGKDRTTKSFKKRSIVLWVITLRRVADAATGWGLCGLSDVLGGFTHFNTARSGSKVERAEGFFAVVVHRTRASYHERLGIPTECVLE